MDIFQIFYQLSSAFIAWAAKESLILHLKESQLINDNNDDNNGSDNDNDSCRDDDDHHHHHDHDDHDHDDDHGNSNGNFAKAMTMTMTIVMTMIMIKGMKFLQLRLFSKQPHVTICSQSGNELSI